MPTDSNAATGHDPTDDPISLPTVAAPPVTESHTEIDGFAGYAYSMSRTLALSLDELNRTAEEQQRALASLTESMMKSTIDLVEQAQKVSSNGSSTVRAALQAATTMAEATRSVGTGDAAPKQPGSSESNAPMNPEAQIDAAAAAALTQAYFNAVHTQLQLNTVGQAALTQIVGTMIDVVASALGGGEAQ